MYLQVADYVQRLIEEGRLAPGAKLPGEIEMAAEYGVARLTIRRAIKELRDRELVITVYGKGTYVQPM